jgi:hypothetical protein
MQEVAWNESLVTDLGDRFVQILEMRPVKNSHEFLEIP